MSFQTYGPFELAEWSDAGIRAVYAAINEGDSGLEGAVGVYIVAAKLRKKLIPFYVGKTDRRSFGHRLKEHFDGEMLEELFHKHGKLYFFLIARVTPKERLRKAFGKRSNSIDRLEFALIGTCLAQNSDLLNKQMKKFHSSIRVPGYINRDVSTENAAAKSLSAMLGTAR